MTTMTTQKQTYNVIRVNNSTGDMEHLGTVEAHDSEHAQCEAEGQFECRMTCSLQVELVESESN